MQPYVDNFSKAAVTVVSDGWDDRARRSLLNVLTVTPMGAMFVKAVNTTGRMKTGQYIHDVLAEAIQELGPENVVQVVTLLPTARQLDVFWRPPSPASPTLHVLHTASTSSWRTLGSSRQCRVSWLMARPS